MKLKIKWLCLYCDTSFSKKEEVLGHLQNDHDDDGNSPVMYEMKSVLCQSNEKCSSTGLEKNQNGNKGKNRKAVNSKKVTKEKKTYYNFKRLANMFNVPSFSHIFRNKASLNSNIQGQDQRSFDPDRNSPDITKVHADLFDTDIILKI